MKGINFSLRARVVSFIQRIIMATNALPKKNPIPVRLDREEDALMTRLARETGMKKSEVLRRACRYAFPKFVTGEVDIARISPV